MRRLLLLLSITAFQASHAQNFPAEKLQWAPRNIGPSGMSGRITAIDVIANNPNTWYVGAASGGVWKTENGGTSFKPIFDSMPTLNIGAIAIQQSNPAVVWVGTGEGIWRSIDAGRSWKKLGLEKTRNIHRIRIDPTNPNIVYVAAIGNPYGIHPERGVYRTTDGGATWNRILYANDTTGCAELVMDPANPQHLIAAMWQHRRTPWSMKSGGTGSGLYHTWDGGATWTRATSKEGMPTGEIGRIGIAFAPSMPNRVYAKIESAKNGLYRSDDGGMQWTLINNKSADVTDRPFYYQEIYVDPQNENRIYDIHSTVTYSEDGGLNFKTLLPYSGIHPDHHAWYIHPTNSDFILDGNDGGMGISRDRGRTWSFPEGLPVGQFYHVNVDNEIPYNVMGGMQDNGSWHGPAYTWTNGGIRNYYWHNVGGGDGFDVVPDPDDASWVWSMSQGGNVGRTNWRTGDRWFVKPPTADTTTPFRFNWNAAIAADPRDPKTLYFGSQFLHRSTNKGASWEVVSPDLTTNNKDYQKIQDENGGLTLDVTGAETFTTILTIAPSPLESGAVWVGTDDGNVQLTRDGGKTWRNFRGRIPGMPTGAWVPQIRAGRHRAGEAFVVVNDYRRADFAPYIFRTLDWGKTWSRLADDKKVRGYALSVIQDPVEPNLIFVGTEHGLWVSLDGGESFNAWKKGYPAASTYDLAIQEREADLVMGTFGRSIWVLDDIRPLRAQAKANGGAQPQPNGTAQMKANGSGQRKTISLVSPPDAYLASYRPAPGYEWSTYGLYEGENRDRGAFVSFFAMPGKGEDTATVHIFNERNEPVRTLRWKADTGLNRRRWSLEERGFRRPGMPKPSAKAAEPGGQTVLPGAYKLVLTLGKSSDSTVLTVKDDPRIPRSTAVVAAQHRFLDSTRAISNRLVGATDRLSDWDESLTKVQAQLRGVEDKEADSLRKRTTAMQDSVKRLRGFILGTPSDRQGIVRGADYSAVQGLQLAQTYGGSKAVAPGAQEEGLLEAARNNANGAIARINAFYNGEWSKYRRDVEAARLKIFKEYEPL